MRSARPSDERRPRSHRDARPPGQQNLRPVHPRERRSQTGYNPTQLLRYWTFIRYVYRQPLIYSHSFLDFAPKSVQDLLAVGWLDESR